MATKSVPTILIMAGGTGGHVFPALAVALSLRDRGIAVWWLGTTTGIESKVVPQHGFSLHTINISGLRGKPMIQLLFLPFKILSSFFKALAIIHKSKATVIVGMGGFVSGPGGLAAWIMRKKIIIHEQNAIAGLTNRLLKNFADKILQSFPATFVAAPNVFYTGNPVRDNIYRVATPNERFQQPHTSLRILILGGSLGSLRFNEIIPQGLKQLSSDIPLDVWHQTGKHKFDEVKQYYKAQGITANVVTFIDAMEKAYAWADIVICRAGASTLTELMAVGVPSILIPYPFAADNHQVANANYLVSNHAALLLEQTQLFPDKLAAMIKSINNPSTLLAMANAAYQLRRADATQCVTEHCLEYL